MSTPFTIAIFVILGIAGFVFLHIGERNAWQRRSQRLSDRGPSPPDVWYSAIPETSHNSIDRCVRLISDVIKVDTKCLHPEDRLHDELSIIDGFFCIAEGDDTTECICDVIEDAIGTRPKGDWVTLQDVVAEFAGMEDSA